MEKTRISSIQLFLLISGYYFGSAVILSPARSAGRDTWLAILLGGAGGILLMWVYVMIALLNPSKTLVDILREKLGNVFGTIVSALYIWYFVHLAALVFRDFGEFICTTTFPETPMIVVVGLLAVVMLYAVNSGIEVLARLSELLVPVIPVIVLIISFSLLTSHDFTAFLPVLENGWAPVLNAAFGCITFPFGEAVVFLMLFPHLNRQENLKKVSLGATAIIMALGIFIFFRDVAVLGSDLMARTTFIPHLSSLLIPEFNVEPLVDVNLLIGGGIKISVCIFAAAEALCKIAGIDDYRTLTGAITTFCVVLSVWAYSNVLEIFDWLERVWSWYSVPVQIIIPLLLLILSLPGKNKLSEKNKPSKTDAEAAINKITRNGPL